MGNKAGVTDIHTWHFLPGFLHSLRGLPVLMNHISPTLGILRQWRNNTWESKSTWLPFLTRKLGWRLGWDPRPEVFSLPAGLKSHTGHRVSGSGHSLPPVGRQMFVSKMGIPPPSPLPQRKQEKGVEGFLCDLPGEESRKGSYAVGITGVGRVNFPPTGCWRDRERILRFWRLLSSLRQKAILTFEGTTPSPSAPWPRSPFFAQRSWLVLQLLAESLGHIINYWSKMPVGLLQPVPDGHFPGALPRGSVMQL